MSAPIKYTCPDIDKYIKWIKMALTKPRDLQKLNERDLFDAAEQMANELESCIDYLEDLRKSNGALRDWGEELEKRVEELENEIVSLNHNDAA
jgi:thiamine kinase-like enzyme